GVAFHDDCLALSCDVTLGQVEAVEDAPLVEDGALRGVQVLGPVLVRVELACAKAHDLPGHFADRPQQPVTEAVIGTTSALCGQTTADRLGVGETLTAQVPHQVLPPCRGEAETEVFGVFPVEATVGQESPSGHGLWGEQLFGEVLGRDPVRLQHPLTFALFTARTAATLLVPQGDTALTSKGLDRLDEAERVDLLYEGDDVTTLVAAEAVPQVLGRGDVEGGGLLVVERAQSFQ